MILALDGRGSTTVWNDAGARIIVRVEGGRHVRHPAQLPGISISTARARQPARYVAVTNCPSVLNLYDDVEFVFNTAYDFKNRFAGEPDYFSAKGEQKGFLLTTNFVADAVNLPLITAKERGAGGGHIRFNMAQGHDRQPHLAISRSAPTRRRMRTGRARM